MGRHYSCVDPHDLLVTRKAYQMLQNTAKNATTIRPPDVRCPVRTRESLESLTRVLAAIAVSVIVFLLWLRRLPQDRSEYPDSFAQCLDSYKVQDGRNVTIKCITCPECPPGQEPTPSCGSNISTETSTGCQICGPQTYSEEHGSERCKSCQQCGLRETISACTTTKGTQCGACPRWHYQADFTLNSCKECSTCCGGRRYAELACMYLKHCARKNCTQQTETKQNHVLKLERVLKVFPTLARAQYQRRKENQDGTQIDVRGPRNLVPADIKFHKKKTSTRFKRENGVPAEVNEVPTRFEAVDLNSSTKPMTHRYYSAVATWSSSADKLERASVDTAPNNHSTVPMELTSSYFGDVKQLLRILIVLVGVGILLLLFIAIVLTCICWGRIRIQWRQIQRSACCISHVGESEESLPVLSYSTPQLDHEFPDGELSGNMASYSSSETIAETDFLGSVPLTKIPLDLRDSLAIKLDVRRNGERLRGWQKVGNQFHIQEDILYYLEDELLKPAGSPTLELIKILETKGKNVLELVNTLNSPEVNYPDVGLLIQRRMEALSD